mgnify:CR=1 FL=1
MLSIYRSSWLTILESLTSLSIVQLANYIMPLVLIPYLAKTIGIEKYGIILVAQSFSMYFKVILDYGFNLTATKQIAGCLGNRKGIDEIYIAIMLAKLGMLPIVSGAYMAIVYIVPALSAHYRVYFYTLIYVVGDALTPVWFFQGIERMRYIAVISILPKMLYVFAVILTVSKPSEYLSVPLYYGLSSLLSAAFAMFILSYVYKYRLPFRCVNISVVKRSIKEGYYVFLSLLLSTILSNTPTVLAGVYLDAKWCGIFAISERLLSGIKNIIAVMSVGVFPRLSSVIKQGKKPFYRMWLFLAFMMIGVGGLLTEVVSHYSELILRIVFSIENVEYSAVLSIRSISLFTMSLIHVTGFLSLLVLDYRKELAKSQIIPTGFFLVIAPMLLAVNRFTDFLYFLLAIDMAIIILRILLLWKVEFWKELSICWREE